MRQSQETYRDVVILALLLAVFVYHSNSLSFTQDDAYISYRYVENFQEGHGLVFNYGERVEGYTNFLWILFLSIALMLGLPMIAVSKILGVAFGAGTLVVAYLYGRECSDAKRWWTRFIAPACLAANGALAYWVIGGLETGLFVFLASLCFFMEFKNRRIVPVLLAIATLVRPEGGLLFGIILIYRVLFARERLRPLAEYVGIYAVLLVPYAIFKLVYFGDLLPNPFYAKTGVSSEYIGSGFEYFFRFIKDYGLYGLFFLMPIPFLKDIPDKIKLAWLAVVIYSAYIILVGGDVLKVHRFFLPILIFFFALFAYLIFRFIKKHAAKPVVALLAGVVVLGYIAWSVYAPLGYIKQTRELERGFVFKMTLVAEQLAKLDRSNFSIATTTIGKVSYILKGHTVIDMLGLTDSHIARNPEKIDGIKTTWKERNFNTEYLLTLKPDYILFSTGQKASAPAERALLLNSHFRQNYSTVGFMFGRSYRVVWKRLGDFSKPNVKMTDIAFADRMYDGMNYYSSKKYPDALVEFHQAGDLCNHDFALIEFFLGQTHMLTGNLDSAGYYFTRSLMLDSLQVETRLALYMQYKANNRPEEAERHAAALRKIAPWLVQD